MEKRISFYEFQSVRSVAKACEPIIKKRNKIRAQIEALADEYKSTIAHIQALEAGVVQVLGVPVEKMVKKVVETDAKGNKTTKFLPSDLVTYDAAKKQYVINLDTEEAGSDFDADVEKVTAAPAEEPEQPAEAPEENVTDTPSMSTPWE